MFIFLCTIIDMNTKMLQKIIHHYNLFSQIYRLLYFILAIHKPFKITC